MGANDCIEEMRRAVPDLTDDEADKVITELRKARQETQATPATGPEDAAVEKAASRLLEAALIEKRNAIWNLAVRNRMLAITRQFGDNAREGYFSVLSGSERLKQGSRASAAAEQKAFAGEWLGGLISDLERAGLHRLFVSDTMGRETARALWALSTPGATLDGLPQEAVRMAEIIGKYQEAARITQNRFGAWIGKLPGYVVRQSHDMYRIREAGFEDWLAYISPRLDWARMTAEDFVGPVSPRKYLERVYDGLASGVHLDHTPRTFDEKFRGASFAGSSNIAKRTSQERVLHFKDADAWFDYNERFGAGGMSEAVTNGLNSAARTSGLLKVLGTNPEANLRLAMDKTMAGIFTPEGRQSFRQSQDQVFDMLKVVDGRAAIPGNATAARVSANLRALQSMAKLGGAVISSITDIPVYASELRYAQGKNMLAGIGEAMGALVRGRPDGERREVLSSLGVFFDSMAGEVHARFDAQDLTSSRTASWLMQKFFKLNGLTWWTETLRSSAALSQSHYMAMQAGKAWDALPQEVQRTLTLYDIDAGKWDVIRANPVKLADGNAYLVPDGLPPELAQTMRTFYIDRAHHAVIEPDARSRWWLTRGSQAGTVSGELFRFIAQFKGFPTAMIQNVVGREVYGKGADSFAQALRNGHGEMMGLATLIAWTTLFGYGAMTAKDMLKGRNPRDPKDAGTWGAAMLQGGAMGIYGDFILGESNRFGRGMLETIAGPVPGMFSDIDKLRAALIAGDDVAANAFRTMVNNTPFANLFYTRVALDYLVLYRLQEAMNPGYLRRLEKRVEKENAQTFWLRPTEAVQ
jgi:hypothetical protein